MVGPGLVLVSVVLLFPLGPLTRLSDDFDGELEG